MAVNHEHRAFYAWPILVGCATRGSTVTYQELGDRIGASMGSDPVYHHAVGWTLGPIQDYCLEEGLPPLTVLVVQKGAGRPGGGFTATDNITAGTREVFAFEGWATLPNPFAYASDPSLSQKSLARKLLASPEAAGEVYARVRVRGVAQQVFRTALMNAYGSACAFCGMTFVEALAAAHILPWAQCSDAERLDPRNGLLLCATHHALFDAGFLRVDDHYVIVHRDTQNSLDTYNKADMWFTRALHGRQLALPDDHRLWPGLHYLRTRSKKK